MATRAQRQQKRARKKQKQRKKQEKQSKPLANRPRGLDAFPAVNARHRQRLAVQKPVAWQGELAEDVAVFDDSALETLPPEVAAQVVAVREALRHALESRGEEARKLTSTIVRGSPLSPWRLFIRGLAAWLANDADAANEDWRRLDRERRPGRIAIAMTTALRTDLQGLSVEAANSKPADETTADWCLPLDDRTLFHGKLLRRVRIDRAGLRVAEAGVRVPEEDPELKVGPAKIRWLKEFAREYRATEPDLVASLEQTALARAFAQNYSDLFESAVAACRGPRHDRRNNLLRFFYYARFSNDAPALRKAEQALDKYLKLELPHNEDLSQTLRGAIASQIHLDEALHLIQSPDAGMFNFFFSEPEDPQAIRRELKAAAAAYPANARVYQTHVEWIEAKLDNDRLTKPRRQPLVKELERVMLNWSRALPDDVEPRLWLVDHLLEDERTEEAKPHVDWLAASRQDDPRVRAAPWKWQLLEAMRLSRRKASLAQVSDHLRQAEALWPAWLSRQWLPYLKAAWSLRSGDADEFQRRREQIARESSLAIDSLPEACMMLAAAQRMRVSAADLKPFREPVDAAVKNLRRVPLDDLLRAGAFFWDLHRSEMLYPAYRMHGGKFAKELWSRLAGAPQVVLERIDDPCLQAAVLWCAERRMLSDNYDMKLPRWFENARIREHPRFTAAKLSGFLNLRIPWRGEEYHNTGALLREAARSEKDAYYRYWFVTLADELDDVLARASSRGWGGAAEMFSSMFGDDEEDESSDYEFAG